MRVVRIILIIIGSALFIPVSCSIGVFGGTMVVAALDARDVSDGDAVHSQFSVVVQPKDDKEAISFLPLYEAQQLKASSEPFSFLMSADSGELDDGSSLYTFQVLEDRKTEQLIEVIEAYKDGDNTIWSRYRATENDIYPVSSKMFYFGYMFSAIPFAFIFSILLCVTGRIFKRYIPPQKSVADQEKKRSIR